MRSKTKELHGRANYIPYPERGGIRVGRTSAVLHTDVHVKLVVLVGLHQRVRHHAPVKLANEERVPRRRNRVVLCRRQGLFSWSVSHADLNSHVDSNPRSKVCSTVNANS